MNVLAKTKYFPGPITDKFEKVKRHPFFQSFLSDWNTLLSDSDELSYDVLLEIIEQKYPQLAMSYYTCDGEDWATAAEIQRRMILKNTKLRSSEVQELLSLYT